MKVRVYYNLTKNIWSVQKHVPGQGWRVAGHLPRLALNNVKTVVNDYGQQQTRVEGKKYVHAFLEGEICTSAFSVSPAHKRITYNPQRDNTFVWKHNGEEFTSSRQVVLTDNAYAL